MLSVILPTIHPGGMDFIVESFSKNPPDWDYELLVVDDYPGRADRGLAEKYLRLNGVKLGWYGPSKKRVASPSHPSSHPSSQPICGWVNAVNTALAKAKGDFVVITQDYTTLTSDWFLRWHFNRMAREEALGHRNFFISGTAVMYVVPKPKSYEDILSWPGEPDVWLSKYQLIYHPWVPEDFETFYWGFPFHFIEQINGFDERADHCGPWINNSVLHQAKILDYQHFVELGLVCQMVDHRAWDDPEKEKHPYLPHSEIGMWKIAGEWRSVEEEPEWACPSPNPNPTFFRD